MRIESLLNPPLEETSNANRGILMRPHSSRLPVLPSRSGSKNNKLAKDAPIFRKAPTKGHVRFPPYDSGEDQALAKEHEKFKIFPLGRIGEFTNHIPYSSDKKTFLLKTGRDAFEGNLP
jgi:hypothetical protein